MNAQAYREIIRSKIPEGTVIPRHTDWQHLYEVVPVGRIFKSVTTRLQVLKDESLINYKMNRALDYIFANYSQFNDANIMEHIDIASKQSGIILEDAGDIGTAIHGYREDYFNKWIEIGARPKNALDFVPPEQEDVRATSAMRGLQNFCIDKDYIPVITEQLVYDVEHEVAGTLDDVGLMRVVKREGDPGCKHEIIVDPKFAHRCLLCDRKYVYELVLMDLKTSNQFKDHYFFQVALYYMMFVKLTGLKPKRCFILKVSKEDGSYKIEELYQIGTLVRYAKAMLRTNQGLDFIRSVRKDNQRDVLKI